MLTVTASQLILKSHFPVKLQCQSVVFLLLFFSQRLHDVVLPLCVRLQQQSSSNTTCESAGGVSGQYSSALSRRELYR